MTKQTEQAIVSTKQGQSQAPVNAFTQLPETFDGAKRYCEYLSSSGIVPKAYQGRPQDIFVAISWGQQVGMTNPIMALNSIAVINGSPSMWGDGPLALVRRSPLCEFILEDNEAFAYARDHIPGWEHLKDVDPNTTSICVGKRVGEPPAAREFSMQDVETAKLGNVHKSYPKDMRKYKARSRLIDSLFADVAQGVSQAELVRENQEQKAEEAEVEELKDGLNNDVLANELSAAIQDPEGSTTKEPENVQDADYEDSEPENTEADLKSEPESEPEPEKKEEPKWADSRTVKDIIKSAKWLEDSEGNKLAKEVSQNNGKLTMEAAESWKKKIREAHEAQKANK